MAQQQERRMQPPSALQAGALAPVPPDPETKYHASVGEQRHDQWVHKDNQKGIWNRSQNRGVKFLPDPERVRQQEWDDMRARQREYDPEADAHRDGASRGG